MFAKDEQWQTKKSRRQAEFNRHIFRVTIVIAAQLLSVVTEIHRRHIKHEYKDEKRHLKVVQSPAMFIVDEYGSLRHSFIAP